MKQGVLFIGGVADGQYRVVPDKIPHYKVPIPTKYLCNFDPIVEEEGPAFHYDSYNLSWWFDQIPIYIEEHMTDMDAVKRLIECYRPDQMRSDAGV